MERKVDVATGESVAFSYELAGLGSRFIAVAIDMAIQFGVVIAAVLLLAWFASSSPVHVRKISTPADVKIAQAILEGIAIFAGFLLFFGYFIVFEWRFAGRSPGKRLVGIRVVRDGGFPVDFTAAVIRNVVRMLEFGLGFYSISAISMLLSPRNRRLGDLAAGTIVVRDGATQRTASLPEYDAPDERDDVLTRDLTPAERELVLRYVERRPTLSAAPRAALATQIAGVIRPRLSANFEHLSDDDFLVHVAGSPGNAR